MSFFDSLPVAYASSVLAVAGEGTTHLKLQKLIFYAYGAALAFDEEAPLMTFHNWQHGPVCVEVYEHFKHSGSGVLKMPAKPSFELGEVATAAVRVYGALSAWQLREESHLEAPWKETHLGQEISRARMTEHFRSKFRGRVQAPRNLPGSWSLAADGLPGLNAGSLNELAAALGR